MIYILLFAAILAILKLSIGATVSAFGWIAGIFIIAICIAIAYRCEAGTAGASKTGKRLD